MKQADNHISRGQFLEDIPFGFIQVDLEGKIIYGNQSAFSFLELSKEELIGCYYNELPWEQVNEDYQPLKQDEHTLYQALKGHTLTSVIQGLKMKGSIRWLSVNSSPMYSEDGNILGAIANIVDATEKVELELEVKRVKHRYEKFISESPFAITVYDKTGLLIAANAKCEDYWQVPIHEYIGKFNIFKSDLFSDEESMARIRHGFGGKAGELTTSISLPHALGVTRTYKIKYYPLFDDDGELENVVYISEDISDFISAQQKTKSEELLKQGILDALGDAILVVNELGIIVNVNKSLFNYVEKKTYRGLKVGASVFNFIELLEDKDYLRKSLNSILSRDMVFFEHEIRLADDRWYNLRVTPLVGQSGAVISWQNINTRKEIEIALEKSLKKYRNIYNRAPVMMHSINRDFKIISVSDYWLEKLGYERNEVIGKEPGDFLAEENRELVIQNIETLLKEGEIKNIEYQFSSSSGERIDVLLSAVAEYDDEGNFERSITGMIDVTDLKAAERELQESQGKLLESQRISKIGNYEFVVATGEFISSPEMSMMMGFDPSDSAYPIINKLIHQEDLEEFERKLQQAISSGNDFFHIYRIIHLKSKKVRWISGRGKMEFDDSGAVVKMIGTVQDITEQRTAEDKIKRLTDRVLLATEIANLGVWEYNKENDEIFWEDQMFGIFTGFTKPAGFKEIKDLLIEEDSSIFEDNLNLIQSGVNFLEDEVRLRIEGKIKYLRSFTRVLRHENGTYKGIIGVVYDITTDKQLQKELEGSLEEKNILIKEVHHRVKNNMQLISSIMALKSYDLEDDASKAIFEEVNNRIKAMSVIHDKLYTFYNVSEIDVREYLLHIAQELQILLGSSSIKLEVVSDEIIMNVDRALLIGLMVSELVSNAIKHGFKDLDGGKIIIEFFHKKESYQLSVFNNGHKVPEDALLKKTGLGVSLIKTFVKQLHGEVSVDSRNGFTVAF